MQKYIDIAKTKITQHISIIVKIWVCIVAFVCLYSYNVATSPVPLAGVTYDNTSFKDKGWVGGAVNWVSYDYKDKLVYQQTDWLGHRTFYYVMGDKRFNYSPLTKEWVQVR